MKRLFVNFAFACGIMLSASAFGMQDLEEILKNRRNAMTGGEDSMESSLLISPRSDEAAEKQETFALEPKQSSNQEVPEKIQAPKRRIISGGLDAIQSISKDSLRATPPPEKKASEQNSTAHPFNVAMLNTKSLPVQSNNNNNNDDEWEDDVSSAPSAPPIQPQQIAEEVDPEGLARDIDEYAPANSNAPQEPEVIHEPLPALPHISQRELPIDPLVSNRPLPALEANPEPIIQEVPEPVEPAIQPHPAHSRAPQKSPLKKNPAPKAPAKSQAPRRPVPPAPTQPVTPNQPTPPAAPGNSGINAHDTTSTLNWHNLIASAGLFGLLTWIQEYPLAQKPNTRKFAVLREILTGAQQALMGNIAQQLILGKNANTATFIATFAGLHAAQCGIKKAVEQISAHTKLGKRIATRYKKLPLKKQNTLDRVGQAMAWVLKSVLAKSIAS